MSGARLRTTPTARSLFSSFRSVLAAFALLLSTAAFAVPVGPILKPSKTWETRECAAYANSGAGTKASPWVGWEDVSVGMTSGVIHCSTGHYTWATQIVLEGDTINDRDGRITFTGDGQGATVFHPTDTARLKVARADGTQATYGFDIGNFTIALPQDIWYGHGVLWIAGSVNFNIHDIMMIGGADIGTDAEYNLYAGYLLELDSSYEGSVRNVSTYGRYVYAFEIDDIEVATESDSITFDTLFVKGPLAGLVRQQNSGNHNINFWNLKYQTNIELAADLNQYDTTTANGVQNAGITAYLVASSASFQAGDPVLIDVGDKLEVNKVSSVAAGQINLAHATRFQHATGSQILHGGVGIGLGPNSSLVTFKSAMFEQCASGVMLDETKFLNMQDIISTCKEVVQVVGASATPGVSSTGAETGLWHGKFSNIQLSRVPATDPVYVVHVKATGDHANIRQLDGDHIELNSSSDDILTEYLNDAAVVRNTRWWKTVGGAQIQERYFLSGYSAVQSVDKIVVGAATIFDLLASGNVTFAGAVQGTTGLRAGGVADAASTFAIAGNSMTSEGATANAFEGVFSFPDWTADRALAWPDQSGTVALRTGATTSGTCVQYAADGTLTTTGSSCGGTPSYDLVLDGINSSHIHTVGTGGSFLVTGTGIVEATRFKAAGSTTNAVDLPAAAGEVAGILPVPNGGTGLSTVTTDALVKGAAAGALVPTGCTVNASNQVLCPGGFDTAANSTDGGCVTFYEDSDLAGGHTWKLCLHQTDLGANADHTIDANGRIPQSALAITMTADGVIDTPVTGDSGKIQWQFPLASTVTRVSCSTDIGTASINFEVRAEATPNTSPGTTVLTAALVCDTGSQTACASGCDVNTIDLAQDNLTARQLLAATVSATASSPTVLRIHVEYTTP